MRSILAILALSLGLGLASGGGEARAPSSAVNAYTTTLTIATYPYAGFLETRHSDAYNMDYPWLNWPAYDASGPSPSPYDYTALVVENPYLKLTFLPELGGRLYGVTIKATGEELLYQNPVIKPTHWGPEEQGWWLAVGGIEWCLPVEEHGYEWGVPWQYTLTTTAGGATVALWDSDATDRVRARITVFLPADQAAFQITPRLENPTGAPVAFKFWDNAMLAPGAANTVGGQLRFVLPIDRVTVHSRGDGYLPGPGDPMSWPVYNGTDYSRLGNWNQWLGFFARPQAAQDWAGVYAEGVRRGVARIFPHEVAVGVKGFGFGWASPIDPNTWTDDGSTYVELHGGPAPTFWDAVTVGAGQSLQWTETWLPLRDLPAFSLATSQAALGLKASGADLEVGTVLAAQGQDVSLRLWRKSDCTLLWQQGSLVLSAGQAYTHALPGLGLSPGEVLLAVFDGDTLLAATGTCAGAPPESQVDPLSSVQTSTTFPVTWTGIDTGGGLASYDIQVRDGDPAELRAGAPWTDWLTGTTDTSALFSGEDGHTYTFRSRARDLLGNVEAWPSGAWQDTFTTVLLEPAPVLITSDKAVNPARRGPGDVVTFTIHVVNSGNLVASVQVTDPLPAGLSLTAGPSVDPPGSPQPAVISDTVVWSGTLASSPPGVTISFEAKVLSLPSTGPIINVAWIDDGVHPPLSRQATVNRHWRIYLPIAVSGQLSAISSQLSAISGQLSAISAQQSVVSNQHFAGP
jgi:uncharacterized repeat protein (TIGR01451 family)